MNNNYQQKLILEMIEIHKEENDMQEKDTNWVQCTNICWKYRKKKLNFFQWSYRWVNVRNTVFTVGVIKFFQSSNFLNSYSRVHISQLQSSCRLNGWTLRLFPEVFWTDQSWIQTIWDHLYMSYASLSRTVNDTSMVCIVEKYIQRIESHTEPHRIESLSRYYPIFYYYLHNGRMNRHMKS